MFVNGKLWNKSVLPTICQHENNCLFLCRDLLKCYNVICYLALPLSLSCFHGEYNNVAEQRTPAHCLLHLQLETIYWERLDTQTFIRLLQVKKTQEFFVLSMVFSKAHVNLHTYTVHTFASTANDSYRCWHIIDSHCTCNVAGLCLIRGESTSDQAH